MVDTVSEEGLISPLATGNFSCVRTIFLGATSSQVKLLDVCELRDVRLSQHLCGASFMGAALLNVKLERYLRGSFYDLNSVI